jgi:hypothetical protein
MRTLYATSPMQKLSPRYARIVTPLILTFIMSAIISGLSTAISVGLNWTALAIWPKAWLASWAIAFPAASLVLPLAQWLTGFVVRRQ